MTVKYNVVFLSGMTAVAWFGGQVDIFIQARAGGPTETVFPNESMHKIKDILMGEILVRRREDWWQWVWENRGYSTRCDNEV